MEIYTSDSSSDSDSREQKTLDFGRSNLSSSRLEIEFLHLCKKEKSYGDIETILLNNNSLSFVPYSISKFINLKILDLSSNGLSYLPEELMQCPLTTLIAKNNHLTNSSLPKTLLSKNGNLRELNLSGNQLIQFPEQVLELKNLRYLYLGGNKITGISKDIWKLQNLQLLSIGGNQLSEVPDCVGSLAQLQALVLCDNIIENLPASIAKLINLKSLLLHKNKLKHLPRDIITLKNLVELSLRDNPLVVRFVQDMALNPPTLMELAARVVKVSDIKFGSNDLPGTLLGYLGSANCCVNPKCQGVFFDSRVEHIKFVDFCGKYRVPLLQYLCSSKCITATNKPDPIQSVEPGASGYMMRKVLLG